MLTAEAPRRIQRSRRKGYRLPEGAVYVGRPSKWGNDARAGDCAECRWGPHDGEHEPLTVWDAIEQYRTLWEALIWTETGIGSMTPEELRQTGVSGIQIDLFEEIRGRDLACWCPLDQPCHADVLLEMANR